MSGVYFDENRKYKIDLSSAIWSTSRLHDLYKVIGNELSDVDWIAETEDEVLLIEYKNPSFVGKNSKNEFYMKVQKKYYGSAFFMLARKNEKSLNFFYIIEPGIMDSVQRGRATASIKRRLPFLLQEDADILVPLINEFRLVNVAEWNESYPEFPMIPVTEGKK